MPEKTDMSHLWKSMWTDGKLDTLKRIIEYNGKQQSLSVWARQFGVSKQALQQYLGRHTFNEAYQHYNGGENGQ